MSLESAILRGARRPGRWLIAALCLPIASGIAAYGAVRYTESIIGPPPLEVAEKVSVTVLDRKGNLLRAFTTPEGRWRLPVDVKDVDPRYISMLLAYEDRRYYEHGGVDPLAVLRAGYQFIRHGRIVSGASTLTMQVARLLDGKHERTLAGKWRQAVRALQLESLLTKDEILNIYLRLAPFGGNLEGLRAASLAYFGKEPRRLSVGEAALLVALPQSPETRRLDRHPDVARRARDRVLDRMVEAGVITEAEAERARAEPVPTRRRKLPRFAPHISGTEAQLFPRRSIHRLTILRDLQAQLETLAFEHARRLGRRLSAAIVVLDNSSGEVLAHVGSSPQPKRLLSPVAAWYVSDILKGAPAPEGALGGWFACDRLGPERAALPPPPGVLNVHGSALPPSLERSAEPGEPRAEAGPYREPAVPIAFPPGDPI